MNVLATPHPMDKDHHTSLVLFGYITSHGQGSPHKSCIVWLHQIPWTRITTQALYCLVTPHPIDKNHRTILALFGYARSHEQGSLHKPCIVCIVWLHYTPEQGSPHKFCIVWLHHISWTRITTQSLHCLVTPYPMNKDHLVLFSYTKLRG